MDAQYRGALKAAKIKTAIREYAADPGVFLSNMGQDLTGKNRSSPAWDAAYKVALFKSRRIGWWRRRIDDTIARFKTLGPQLPDKRTGKNCQYTMSDIILGAFAVFFLQCPSFLARQKAMQQQRGRSNTTALFNMERTPCDNHIRDGKEQHYHSAILPVIVAPGNRHVLSQPPEFIIPQDGTTKQEGKL